MWEHLQEIYSRFRMRRELRRKGIIAPKRWVDWGKFTAMLDNCPAPGIFTLVIVWSFCSVMLTVASQHQLMEVRNLVDGQLIPRTFISQFDFSYEDPVQTKAEREEVLRSQPLYFRVDPALTGEVQAKFADFFAQVELRLDEEKAKRIYRPETGSVPAEMVESLAPDLLNLLGSFCHNHMARREFDRELNSLLIRGVIGQELLSSLKVSQTLRIIDLGGRAGLKSKPVTDQTDSAAAAGIMAQAILKYYPAGVESDALQKKLKVLTGTLLGSGGNLVPDEIKTQENQQLALARVEPVVIQKDKGDPLVIKNETVTPGIRAMLDAYMQHEREARRGDREWRVLGQNMTWSLVLVIFAAFYLYHLHPEIVRVNKRTTMLGLIVIFSMIANCGGFYFFHFLLSERSDLPYDLVAVTMPVALVAVLSAVTFGYRVALCAGFFMSCIVAMMLAPERAFDIAIKGIVICSLCALAVRSATNYRAFFIRIVVSVLPLTWLLNLNLFDPESEVLSVFLMQSGGLALTNAFATAVIALILVFVLEIVFNVSTNMALMVLCDYNHPLMERLKREAPGTFFHSLMVATLAEDAARAIGANPLKAKAGALFHDVGKLSMPQYFTENNMGAPNQHIDLNPQMSSIIIRDHVKEGLLLARQHRMCRTVRDAIDQHHGTDLVRFFYAKALAEKRENPAPVLESQFRYQGHLPQDREMAVISLADACEAACRSLEKPSSAKIETVVDEIFRTRIADGQLKEANITLAELEKVRLSFISTLISMKHVRITYPKENTADGQA